MNMMQLRGNRQMEYNGWGWMMSFNMCQRSQVSFRYRLCCCLLVVMYTSCLNVANMLQCFKKYCSEICMQYPPPPQVRAIALSNPDLLWLTPASCTKTAKWMLPWEPFAWQPQQPGSKPKCCYGTAVNLRMLGLCWVFQISFLSKFQMKCIMQDFIIKGLKAVRYGNGWGTW